MMKYISLWIFLLLLVAGCKPIDENTVDKNFTDDTFHVTTWIDNTIPQDKYEKWILWLTGEIIGEYNTLIKSWNTMNYNNIFKINIPEYISQWSYELRYLIGYQNKQDGLWYWEKFTLGDSNWNFIISISESTYHKDWNISEKEHCMPEYQEWTRSQPETKMYTQDEQNYYITYATFNIDAPDTVSSKNYQSELCFIKNDKIYHLTVWNSEKYRKDIVEWIKFIY